MEIIVTLKGEALLAVYYIPCIFYCVNIIIRKGYLFWKHVVLLTETSQPFIEVTFAVLPRAKIIFSAIKDSAVGISHTGPAAFITHTKTEELTRLAASCRIKIKQLMMTEPLSANTS